MIRNLIFALVALSAQPAWAGCDAFGTCTVDAGGSAGFSYEGRIGTGFSSSVSINSYSGGGGFDSGFGLVESPSYGGDFGNRVEMFEIPGPATRIIVIRQPSPPSLRARMRAARFAFWRGF